MSDITTLIEGWARDKNSTYNSWFLWEERIKNFRSIRRGILKIIAEIEGDEFGRVYRESSLEMLLHSITEQKQIFKGADHAFIWKPKLRIPDIYENRENQKAFGDSCPCVLSAAHVTLTSKNTSRVFRVTGSRAWAQR